MAYFYTHLINIETILVSLEDLKLSDKEKKHLAQLLDSNLHHTILDAVLSELSPADKQEFLKHLSASDHDKIWQLLNQRVDKIEDKIKQTADEFISEVHKDIKEAKEHVAKKRS